MMQKVKDLVTRNKKLLIFGFLAVTASSCGYLFYDKMNQGWAWSEA
jgi:hypothetical protein